jgi:hypothetical protein
MKNSFTFDNFLLNSTWKTFKAYLESTDLNQNS